MFTKESIIDLFTKRNGQNFIINTNEAVGKGINGVDFTAYVGARTWDDRKRRGEKCHNYSTILAVEDNYITLMVDYLDNNCCGGYTIYKKEIVIPMSNITSIQFIVSSNNGCPSTIEKNKLFSKPRKSRKAADKEAA